MFRFGDRDWGQDISSRKRLFLQGMGFDSDECHGRLILDTGCGSGLLSIEMAKSLGMEVVALDLAFGIEKAYQHNVNPFVHFVQASVLELPLRSRSVDYVYCAGVLVAIPDTKVGFNSIIKTLKESGRCFIWVYHPLDRQHHPHDYYTEFIYNWTRQNITSKLPIRVQYYLYLSLMPLFWLKQRMNKLRGVVDDRNWREKMQNMFDSLSPIYQNRHTEEEVVKWFKGHQFSKVEVSDRGGYGFGVRGDLSNTI